MKFKYQLIVLGNLGEISDQIIDLFFEKIQELNLKQDYFKIIDRTNFRTDYKGNQPAFAIYFGNKSQRFADVGITEVLLKDGTMILPIFYNSFSNDIPTELSNQNGLEYENTKNIKIVNLALEAFELLRSSRKVFVSYKRDESTSVAIQLYEALEKNNFDVFLDTHSIKQGEAFQEELWHRMTDCDVVILLNTKGFLTSEWCEAEIAEASAKQIGVIQLVWPNHTLEAMARVCMPFQLEDKDFENKEYEDKNKSKLKDGFVKELIEQVESVRARNLASRQDTLITEFTTTAKRYNRKINLQPEKFITEELQNGKRRIFIPTVGIPQSFNCNQSEELIKEIIDYNIVDSIYLIYDDLRIRNKWLNHLDWLNNYLEVKTLKKQNFDKWLRKN